MATDLTVTLLAQGWWWLGSWQVPNLALKPVLVGAENGTPMAGLRKGDRARSGGRNVYRRYCVGELSPASGLNVISPGSPRDKVVGTLTVGGSLV